MKVVEVVINVVPGTWSCMTLGQESRVQAGQGGHGDLRSYFQPDSGSFCRRLTKENENQALAIFLLILPRAGSRHPEVENAKSLVETKKVWRFHSQFLHDLSALVWSSVFRA